MENGNGENVGFGVASSDLVPVGEASAGAELAEVAKLTQEARDYIQDAKAKNTIRAYTSDWKDFTDWCKLQRRESLPASPETVALYITHLARGLKTSTIQRRISSISQAHVAAGYDDSPTKTALVRATWQGIRRSKGVAAQGKAPVLMPDLRAMMEHLPKEAADGKKKAKEDKPQDGASLAYSAPEKLKLPQDQEEPEEAGENEEPRDRLIACRDRALLLLGFAGAMRRSELVGLDVADVVETSDGLVVTIRRSKTDQEGQGRKIGIPYGSKLATCPVRSLRAWKIRAGITEGPLFRQVNRHGKVLEGQLGDRAVALVVKRAVAATGVDAASYAGHSLRAGLATAAAMAGVSERVIQGQTGHKSLPILRRYIREGSLFRKNAAAEVGL
ncbi:tyrosine-type recombinase/integrase [Armatimonas sp.]|uniref:tyrosine-type recombinase/integrase n=1 Tax=Armatimonas sp. TaxID=1872638 RepID=UPI00374CEF08